MGIDIGTKETLHMSIGFPIDVAQMIINASGLGLDCFPFRALRSLISKVVRLLGPTDLHKNELKDHSWLLFTQILSQVVVPDNSLKTTIRPYDHCNDEVSFWSTAWRFIWLTCVAETRGLSFPYTDQMGAA